NTVPSAMAELLRQEGVPASVVTVNLAGEALPRALADQIYAVPGIERLYNLYGPSEDTTYSTFVRVARISERMPPIGRPLAGTQGYVVDRFGQPVPAGVAGELLLGGGGLARGYLGRPELTAERFVPDAYGEPLGGRLYRTGDLARSLADGTLEFLGRLDHQIKIRGFRIEPGEIESALLGHEGVREVAVVPQADPRGDQRLVAYVAPHPGVRLAMDELRSFLRRRLPDYMVPGAWVELSALPRSSHGKLDRRALPAPESALHGTSKALLPRDPLELELARLWEDLLGVEGVGVHDDFFTLGGHSLLAVRLATRIQKTFGVALPVASFFQAPTLESMAGLLRQRGEAPGTPPHGLVPLKSRGILPPLFLIHAGAGHVLSYLALSRRLPGSDRPVFGVQSETWSGGEGADEIEAMAERYVRRILAVQPHGPYHLAGWSLGGVVAFEMARRLEESGHRVGLLALIDSRAPRFGAAAPELGDLDLLAPFARDLGLSEEDLRLAAPGARAAATLPERLSLLLDLVRETGVLPPGTEAGELARLFAEYRRNVQAMLRYVPQPFAGSALLLAAGDSPESPREAARGWEDLVGDLAIATVPGDHHTMVRPPHVESLATALTMALQDSERD
ncbi:MAG TPA: thioesterase domain-containing protein, partial [Thermoanaerobaculia bacterium]|nr:thioesterase domain-containing protein [Thermoanaerobaculia bacterium]